MSINIEIAYKGTEQLAYLLEALQDKPGMHDRIAREALLFVKEFGASKSSTEHRTAETLGAQPTGHLERAYAAIEGKSDEASARLLVPGASRLRAAFGAYTLTPKNSAYLTLPVHREAYGRRAGEFEDLFPVRVGPRKSLVLARQVEGGGLETMYFLTTSENIPEDATLIPFEEIYEGAGDSVEAFLDEAIARGAQV
jgi:hypothetical protein